MTRESKDHKPRRPMLQRGRADRRDYGSMRAQHHKKATIAGCDLVFFDRPGDSVEGYISGPYRQPGPTQSHYRIEREGYVIEIKNHMLLGEIIRTRRLIGEYVRIVYRGWVIARPGDRHGNKCKSYYVYSIPRIPVLEGNGDDAQQPERLEPEDGFEGVAHTKRHLALVPWNYPKIEAEKQEDHDKKLVGVS